MNKVRLLGGILILTGVFLNYKIKDLENASFIKMVIGMLIGYSFFLVIFGRFNIGKKDH